MNQGVIILSLKKSAYSLAAFNLALSIKYFNPNINITLVSDGEHRKHYQPQHYAVFDWIKDIDECHYVDFDGTFQPALAKININKYSSYNGTLYIDADSICFQDLQPLFDTLKGNSFKGNIVKDYTQWTSAINFREFFGFDYGKVINSSWFYFEDSKVFDKANEFYSKGFKKENINPKWGNTFPDELFFNASLIALNIDCSIDFDLMFYGNLIDNRETTEIVKTHYLMTLYGNRKTTRLIYLDYYDRLMNKICISFGFNHKYKVDSIMNGKHVNK